MNHCPTEQQLGVYYDGRMSAAEREAMAAHLADCSACQLVIARFTALSRLFAQSPAPRLSQIARARLDRRMDAMTDRGLLRLAWTLSGVAASVLVVCSAWLTHLSPAPAPAAAPPWVGVSYASDVIQTQREPATPAAQWYLANAASASDESP